MDPLENQQPTPLVSSQPVEQSPQKAEHNSLFPKVLFILLGVVIVLGLLVGAYYFWGKRTAVVSKEATVTKPVVTIIPKNLLDAKQVLVDLESNLKLNCPIKEVDNINWNYGSTQNVLFSKGEEFFPCASDNASPYITFNTKDNNAITEEALQPLQTAVDNFFTSHGFLKDSSNTMKNTGESKTGIDIGYTKGYIKCKEELSPRYADFANFQCTETSQEIDSAVNELGQILNPSKNSTIQVITINIVSNFVEGNISTSNPANPAGLRYFIAEKINGEWKVIWTGEGGTIGCSLVKKYKIPDAVLPVMPNFNLPSGKEPLCVENK